jgi:hypothetical protein
MQIGVHRSKEQTKSEGEREMTKKSSVKKGSKLGGVKPLKKP